MKRKSEDAEKMRRYDSPTYGKRFVGNTNKKEVHDLDNEKTGPNEFIKAGHARTFNPDTLEQAKKEGYDNCAYCLGGSKW